MRTVVPRDSALPLMYHRREIRNFRVPNGRGGFRYYMDRGTLRVVVPLWAKDLRNRDYCARILWRERQRLQRMVARHR